MNKIVVKRIGIGVILYAIFTTAVLNLYPDEPHSMGWEDRQEYNKVQISKLSIKQNKHEILELLGGPDITQAKMVLDKEVQVMFYRTEHKQADGITTIDECIALLFEDNKLVEWGDNAYQTFINK